MCRLSEAELYCVRTNMRITSELMQFEIGTSTRRYLPPSGTAGLERSRVSGNRRLPAPPPRMTASKLFLVAIGCGEDIGKAGEVSRTSRGAVTDRVSRSIPADSATLSLAS